MKLPALLLGCLRARSSERGSERPARRYCALQVCEGDVAAEAVRDWLTTEYNGGLHIEVGRAAAVKCRAKGWHAAVCATCCTACYPLGIT
jgi:hypothetical protein